MTRLALTKLRSRLRRHHTLMELEKGASSLYYSFLLTSGPRTLSANKIFTIHALVSSINLIESVVEKRRLIKVLAHRNIAFQFRDRAKEN